MKATRILIFTLALVFTGGRAHAGHGFWSVGVSIGAPTYYRPWYGCAPYPYFRTYPVFVQPVAPVPVLVAPAPTYQPALITQPSYSSPPATLPPPRPVNDIDQASIAEPRPISAADIHQATIARLLKKLGDPDQQIREDSLVELGRLKARQAVDPASARLAGDNSPQVREAAARALGLIGSPKALPALRHAAQSDSDHDVRRSAAFAVEIIQADQSQLTRSRQGRD